MLGNSYHDRYGIRKMTPKVTEKNRLHNLVALRIAKVLNLMSILGRPFVYEVAAVRSDQVSVAHLDEYVELMSLKEVTHTVGVQCSFGALPSALKTCKTSSWFHSELELPNLRGPEDDYRNLPIPRLAQPLSGVSGHACNIKCLVQGTSRKSPRHGGFWCQNLVRGCSKYGKIQLLGKVLLERSATRLSSANCKGDRRSYGHWWP